jgi:signal transduction histidine kinase
MADRYRVLFDSIDEGFCIIRVLFDDDGRPVDYVFVETNPAWSKHAGLTAAEGRRVRELLPDLEEHWFEIYGRVARTGECIRFESGSEVMGRWFNVFAFRVDDPADGHVAILFTDITERRVAEAALRESEREARELAAALATERSKLEAVIENLPVGVGIGTPSGETLLLNRTGLALHGFSSSAEMLASLDDYGSTFELRDLDGCPLPLADWPVSRALRGDFVRGFEVQLANRAAGSERIVSYDVAPVRDDAGRVVLFVYVVQDLTQAKRGEAELLAAKRAAEAASDAKSQFLAVMSHELRTPLTGIIGFADLLGSQVYGPVTERQREALERIGASSWHLVGIIDEILTYSRAEAGTETAVFLDVDMTHLVREVVRIMEPHASGAGLTLQLDGAEEPRRVRTDPDKARRILINLVGNAVKYTPSGSVTVHLDGAAGDGVAVHVHDTGAGIAPADHARIFEPFTQVDSSATRTGGGIGLGLAISLRLARLLGGDITLASVPGAGSTFTLHLPGSGSWRDGASTGEGDPHS